jgi:predicted nucleic acid-binding protein
MFVLDTNVLSEASRPAPSWRVLDWLEAQPRTLLFATTISEAEMLLGVALLPAGKRRSALGEATHLLFTEDFDGRVLQFDRSAANAYAEICARRRRLGRPISTLDAQIAAIARAHGAAVATRNVADFTDCGIEVVDPWQG